MGGVVLKEVDVRNRLPAGDLVLRPAVPDDRDALVRLQALVHGRSAGGPNRPFGIWAGDLVGRPHPSLDVSDVSVVVDRRGGELVSTVALIRQVWTYAGVPFGVGRVELAATHPDHRGQGLVSRQVKLLHERSTSAGDLAQAITDLAFFHGELGYHMALVQRAGRGGAIRELPPVPAGDAVTLRPATLDDIPTLVAVDRSAQERVLLCCARDRDMWVYELVGRSPGSVVRDEVLVIEANAEPVGYVAVGYGGIACFPVPEWLPGRPCPEPVVSICGLELLPGVSWLSVVPRVVRQLAAMTHSDGYLAWLGTSHPAYTALLGATSRRPPGLGWFLRVPDLVRMLRQVAPVLERRVFHSPARNFTGTLRLHFYTHGVVLEFVKGRLDRVEDWPEHSRRTSDASMPKQMFLQLLMGHARLADVAPMFPDARVQTHLGKVILPILFPRHPSHVWPVA